MFIMNKMQRFKKEFLYFGLFFIPLIMNPFGFQLYGIIKVSWFLLFIGLAIAYALMNGLIDNKISFKYNNKVVIFVLLWSLSLIASTVFSLNPIKSAFGDAFTANGSLLYLFLFVHFFICWQIFSLQKNREIFFIFVKFLGILISIHAIGQYFNVDPFSDVDNKEYLFRVYSNVGQPNFLAQLLIFPFFILFFGIVEFLKEKKYKKLFLELLFLLIIGTAIYLTKSRAVVLAIFATLFLWFIFVSNFKKWIKSSVVALIAGGAGFMYLFFDLSTRSIHSRLFLWRSAREIIDMKNLFFGNGINSFYRTFVEVMPKEVFEYEQFYTTPTNIHNETLQILLERGFFGLILYLIPIGFLIWLLFKKKILKKEVLISGFVIFSYIISVQFSFSAIENLVFLFAFLAILLTSVLGSENYSFNLRKVFHKVGFGIVFTCISIFVLFSSFSLVKADILMKKGMDLYIVDRDASFVTFENAINSVPVFDYPRKVLIDLFSPFVKDIESSLKLEKHLRAYGKITNYDYNFNILAMEIVGNMIDGYDIVEFYYQKGLKDSPNLPIFYTIAGNISYEIGDCERAVIRYGILESLAPIAYSFKDSANFEEHEKYRLFIKHASAFERAMKNKKECEFRLGHP